MVEELLHDGFILQDLSVMPAIDTTPHTPSTDAPTHTDRCLEYFIISPYICIVSISQWTCHNHYSGVELRQYQFDAASIRLVLAQFHTTVMIMKTTQCVLFIDVIMLFIFPALQAEWITFGCQ